MSAHAVIPQAPAGKVETKPESAVVALQKPALASRTSVYWGDRFTFHFWLFGFGLMAAMNLFEAVHRVVLYFFGSSPSP